MNSMKVSEVILVPAKVPGKPNGMSVEYDYLQNLVIKTPLEIKLSEINTIVSGFEEYNFPYLAYVQSGCGVDHRSYLSEYIGSFVFKADAEKCVVENGGCHSAYFLEYSNRFHVFCLPSPAIKVESNDGVQRWVETRAKSVKQIHSALNYEGKEWKIIDQKGFYNIEVPEKETPENIVEITKCVLLYGFWYSRFVEYFGTYSLAEFNNRDIGEFTTLGEAIVYVIKENGCLSGLERLASLVGTESLCTLLNIQELVDKLEMNGKCKVFFDKKPPRVRLFNLK